MYAAYHNHVGVANVLIESNCDLNTTDYVKHFSLLYQKIVKIYLLIFFFAFKSKDGVHCIGRQIVIISK